MLGCGSPTGATFSAVDASGLVINADLPTVLTVGGIALGGMIVGPMIRRAWSERGRRRFAAAVAEAVVEALDRRQRGAGSGTDDT